MSEEFTLDFELDEIDLGIDEVEVPQTSIPKVYLLLENLVMLQQVKGLTEESPDLITVPAYAYKGEELKLVGTVELTADNVLTMQLLGLKVSLIREGKTPILFDCPDDYIAIIKTVKESDTIDISDSSISDNNGELDEGPLWVCNNSKSKDKKVTT